MADELAEFIEKSGGLRRLHEAANEKERQMRAVTSTPKCGYCLDCKWWDGRHGDLTGRCLKVLHLDALLQPDGECNIETSPNFGCVQFEAK